VLGQRGREPVELPPSVRASIRRVFGADLTPDEVAARILADVRQRGDEAVLEYTGADHVNVVSHSMGVTLSRKAIKGGMGWDGLAGGYYDLGRPLTDKVDTFVGIAGANQGLASCFKAGPTNPTSGITNGFYPGIAPGGIGQSWFLQNLNTGDHFEGNHVFSIWSTVDEICGPGNLVFGAHTSEIPGQDGEKVFKRYPYGHFNLKDRTAAIQFDMITKHRAG